MTGRGVRIILRIVWLLVGAALVAFIGYGLYYFVIDDTDPDYPSVVDRMVGAVSVIAVIVLVVLFLAVLRRRLSERQSPPVLRRPDMSGLMVVTTQSIEDWRVVRTLGPVIGNTIRANHVGSDLMARLRSLVGGEVHEYTKLRDECRELALHRMMEHAEQLGANAVLNVRFSMSMNMSIGGAAEMLAYGTAVVVERDTP